MLCKVLWFGIELTVLFILDSFSKVLWFRIELMVLIILESFNKLLRFRIDPSRGDQAKARSHQFYSISHQTKYHSFYFSSHQILQRKLMRLLEFEIFFMFPTGGHV